MVDSGLIHYFGKDAADLPAEEAVERAAHGAAPRTRLLVMPLDGEGVGPALSADFAFEWFGPHARSLPLMYLLLVGVSLAAFVARYQDERLLAAPVFLLALTLLLFTQVALPFYAEQAPVGGIRYYVLVGILPALHWCFDLADRTSASWVRRSVRWVLLGVQVTILGFAILVRMSPIYLLVLVMGSAILAVRAVQTRPERLAVALRTIVPLAVLVVVLGRVAPFAFPEYVHAGRASGVFWHRAFIGFASNPAWPFPGVREQYLCAPAIPEGIQRFGGDRNGHCVWLSYGPNHTRNVSELGQEIYNKQYETVLRGAFFHIISSYPLESLKTFVYYKPKMLGEQMLTALQPVLSDRMLSLVPLAAGQLLVLILFISVTPVQISLRDVGLRESIPFLFLLPALGPQLWAWTLPSTALDVTVFLLCGGILGFSLVIPYALQAGARRVGLVPHSRVLRNVDLT